MATAIPPNTTVNIYPTPQSDRDILDNFLGETNNLGANSPIPTHSIRPVLNGANANLALQPKGTGAFLASMPDNTTAGGNKRGEHAVDLQTNRLSASQVAAGNHSVIGGGKHNTITVSSLQAVIGGGSGNSVDGEDAALVGGAGNSVLGVGAFIGAGRLNVITATGAGNAIVAGYHNGIGQVTPGVTQYGTVVGGYENKLLRSASDSFIGGGRDNQLSDGSGVIVGGYGNRNNAGYSVLGGGYQNRIGVYGQDSPGGVSGVLCGGTSQVLTGDWGFIGGGYLNACSGTWGAVCGGNCNTVSADGGFIGGGNHNVCASPDGVICGGGTNVIETDSEACSILGGRFNTISALAGGSVILGGRDNFVGTLATCAGILPGSDSARADRAGEIVHASGRGFPRSNVGIGRTKSSQTGSDGAGTCQWGQVEIATLTVGDDSQELTIPQGTGDYFKLPRNSEVFYLRIFVMAATETAIKTFTTTANIVRKSDGTVALIGTPSTLSSVAGSGWLATYHNSFSFTVSADNVNKRLSVVVTTANTSGASLNWGGYIEYHKVRLA